MSSDVDRDGGGDTTATTMKPDSILQPREDDSLQVLQTLAIEEVSYLLHYLGRRKCFSVSLSIGFLSLIRLFPQSRTG